MRKMYKKLIQKNRKRTNRSATGNFLLFCFISFIAVFMALPILYSVSSALKPLDELWEFPPRFFVRNPTFENFSDLFLMLSELWIPFTRYLFNTVFITVIGILGHVLAASMAAYPLAKHKFPGHRILFALIIMSLMFSDKVTAIPNYLVVSKLGLIDSYFAIILPAFSIPLGLFLMKQFMENIPDSIIESARIDGSNEYRTFWFIIMPSVKPAWLTVIIFSFQNLWGNSGANFIYSEAIKPLPYAMRQIQAGGYARTGAAFAANLLMISVPIVLFIFVQSNIIETMTSSGIKE